MFSKGFDLGNGPVGVTHPSLLCQRLVEFIVALVAARGVVAWMAPEQPEKTGFDICGRSQHHPNSDSPNYGGCNNINWFKKVSVDILLAQKSGRRFLEGKLLVLKNLPET